jgi:hypothetical protein
LHFQESKHYESLNEMYGEAETEYIYDSFSRNVNDFGQSHYEDIYQTIFPPKQPRQSLSLLGGGGKKSKRAAPIQELTETEDTYLENLIMVRDVFREKLSNMSPFHKSIIFFQLDDLILLHSDILFGLKRKKADIGVVFKENADRMSKLYGLYCVNLPIAMDVLSKLAESNAALKRQMYDCQLKAKPTTFPLSSHLVIPFQRFLKYHLLLKEILKHTPNDYSDHASISEACDLMLQVSREVNETKREHEDGEKLVREDEEDMRLIFNVGQTIKLMQLPNGAQLTDFGRLRKAGDITAYNEYGKVADYAFLFDMVIVLCHRPKWLQHRFRFREAARVKDYFIEPLPQMTDNNADSVFSVRLFWRIDGRKPPLTLIAKTAGERDAWFNALLNAMDSVNPSENASQGHVLQMTTFVGDAPAECNQCNKVLLGRFFQGYRCMRCQAILHKGCIAQCACIEVGGAGSGGNSSFGSGGGLKRVESVTLPTAVPDTMERSNSTLSLAATNSNNGGGGRDSRRNSARMSSSQVQEMQVRLQMEMENTPIEDQPWYAGPLSGKVATDRLENLPVGTYLVRQRANGMYALMLKTPEPSKGVKAMAIHQDAGEFFFSGARKFDTIQKLVAFYRTRDLTENFDYSALKGVHLKTPYKNL